MPASRPAVLACLTAVIAATYGMPFYGLMLSVLIPLLTRGRQLWPSLSQRHRTVWSVVAWVGLWSVAALDLFTPVFYGAGVDVSTSWLVIPLCGPDSQVTLLVPAAVATVTCLVGLGVSVLRGHPWAWVAAAWLAPWAHQVAFSLVPDGFSC
jgi:hypothetical protein